MLRISRKQNMLLSIIYRTKANDPSLLFIASFPPYIDLPLPLSPSLHIFTTNFQKQKPQKNSIFR